MKKIKIMIIIAIAVIGALLIYNHFEKINKNKEVIDKFSSEYTLVKKDHIFKYTSIDEILNIYENGTGIIFFCTPESDWCQKYAFYLNETVKENNINEIYYLNIKEYRELNTNKYKKIVEYLDNYIYKDDINNKKIFMPDLSFVNNGVIVAHDNETSLIESDADPNEYWTDTTIKKFKNKINNYIILMNEELKIDEEVTE